MVVSLNINCNSENKKETKKVKPGIVVFSFNNKTSLNNINMIIINIILKY